MRVNPLPLLLLLLLLSLLVPLSLLLLLLVRLSNHHLTIRSSVIMDIVHKWQLWNAESNQWRQWGYWEERLYR